MKDDLKTGWKTQQEWKIACCDFQKDAGEIGLRRISFCIVINGLERGCKPIMAIISADEGKWNGIIDTSEEET